MSLYVNNNSSQQYEVPGLKGITSTSFLPQDQCHATTDMMFQRACLGVTSSLILSLGMAQQFGVNTYHTYKL